MRYRRVDEVSVVTYRCGICVLHHIDLPIVKARSISYILSSVSYHVFHRLHDHKPHAGHKHSSIFDTFYTFIF